MKHRWFYRAITGEAASLLYKDKTVEEVQKFLWKNYIEDTGATEEAIISPRGNNISESRKETAKKLKEIFLKRWQRQGKSYYDFKRAWDKRYFNPYRFQDALNTIKSFWIKRE